MGRVNSVILTVSAAKAWAPVPRPRRGGLRKDTQAAGQFNGPLNWPAKRTRRMRCNANAAGNCKRLRKSHLRTAANPLTKV